MTGKTRFLRSEVEIIENGGYNTKLWAFPSMQETRVSILGNTEYLAERNILNVNTEWEKHFPNQWRLQLRSSSEISCDVTALAEQNKEDRHEPCLVHHGGLHTEVHECLLSSVISCFQLLLAKATSSMAVRARVMLPRDQRLLVFHYTDNNKTVFST